MPIKDSIYFNYDGVCSDEFGIINVAYDVGMYEEPFSPEQEIHEVIIPGRDDPYFVESKRLPLQIDLQFAFRDGFGENNCYLNNASRWLIRDYYKPLIFSEQPEKIYYCVYVGQTNLLHNCNSEGFIEISMRNIDPYARSPFYQTEVYESPAIIEFNNIGDVDIKPIIQLNIIDDTSITIINNTNNTSLEILDLNAGDLVEIDTNYGTIKGVAYGDMEINNFKLDVGENKLLIAEHDKDWLIKLKYQYKFL